MFTAEWDAVDLGFTPLFSIDWYDYRLDDPQITFSQVYTSENWFGFDDDLATADKDREALYALDVWSKGDKGVKYSMREEVDRIIALKRRSPGGGLIDIDVGQWKDLDEVQISPKIYRCRAIIKVSYVV